MFDLVTGQTRHIPSKPALPFLISVTAQFALVTAVVLPVLVVADALPEIPTMIAFVAEAPAPPPPPPPPPPPAPPAQKIESPAQTQPTPTSDAAPVDAPSTIAPERPIDTGDIGVPGGVEGGIPGGIVGGVPGGLLSEIPPPPPPPAPAPPRAPVRVGGQIKPPELVRRVEPIYPDVAVSARLTGTVILEAQVDKDGRVVDLKVLRSGNRLLDDAAMAAVKQWRYRPLILNGQPEQFVLTVVLTFNLQDS